MDKKIDAFFKKKDISHSELRTLVETNIDTSMPVAAPCAAQGVPRNTLSWIFFYIYNN